MPNATKKHRYAKIAPHPVRTAPRDAAWADSPEAVVAGKRGTVTEVYR